MRCWEFVMSGEMWEKLRKPIRVAFVTKSPCEHLSLTHVDSQPEVVVSRSDGKAWRLREGHAACREDERQCVNSLKGFTCLASPLSTTSLSWLTIWGWWDLLLTSTTRRRSRRRRPCLIITGNTMTWSGIYNFKLRIPFSPQLLSHLFTAWVKPWITI